MNWNEKLNEILERAKNLAYRDEKELDSLRNKIELYNDKIFGEKKKYGAKSRNIHFHPMFYPCSPDYEISVWEGGKNQLINLIESIIEDFNIEGHPTTTSSVSQKSDKKVFIVHGHDETLKYNISNWLYSLELEPVILHLRPNSGVSNILSKIERNSDVGCAVVLFTADDEGKSKLEENYKDRARQNVVFEAGYFIGKLGAENVILLYEEGVEMPGDLSGCIYILADKNGGWKDSLRAELDNMEMNFKR